MNEVAVWRSIALGLLVGFGAVSACQQSKAPKEIVLRSDDGKREVRLTADGLQFREDGRTTELTYGQLKLTAGPTTGRWTIEDGSARLVMKDKSSDAKDRPFIRASFDTRRKVRNSTGDPVSGLVIKAGEKDWGSKTIIHASESGGYLTVQDGRDKRTTIFPRPSTPPEAEK